MNLLLELLVIEVKVVHTFFDGHVGPEIVYCNNKLFFNQSCHNTFSLTGFYLNSDHLQRK